MVVCSQNLYVATYEAMYVCICMDIIFLYLMLCIYILDVPAMVPIVSVDKNTVNINENNVKLTLHWEEPFNNLDPIVNYTVTVSCSDGIICPRRFTTIDNATRSYTITNLTTMTKYAFSVVATNSLGSGEAGVVNYTTPGMYVCT